MNKVLYHLCRQNVSIMDGWLPFPSTALSESCGMTLYQTRKELKKLKEQGLGNQARILGHSMTEMKAPFFHLFQNEKLNIFA